MKGNIIKINGNKITFRATGTTEEIEAELSDWVNPDFAKIGEADVEFKDEKVSFIGVRKEKSDKPSKPIPNASESKDSNDMINLDDLLADAHTKGLQSITTEIVTIDHEKKYAVFKAVVTMKSKDGIVLGAEFHGHGDADVVNCTGLVKDHWIRMAETRAIVRALRWATNNATAAEEEKK